MIKRNLMLTALLLFTLAVSVPAVAQQAPGAGPAGNPLAPFERLIGGQWHVEGSYQEFEWGLGNQSVRSRAYFVIDGEPRLVSEGFWYWHPGEKTLKGVFTAVDMPVALFDYTTRFENGRMVSELRAFDAAGIETGYREIFEFTDETHYVWKLLRKTQGGTEEAMSATYSRRY